MGYQAGNPRSGFFALLAVEFYSTGYRISPPDGIRRL
jgi:hypothetical protein